MSRNDDLSMPKASFAQDRCPQDQCLNEAAVDHSPDFAASVDADRRSRQIIRLQPGSPSRRSPRSRWFPGTCGRTVPAGTGRSISSHSRSPVRCSLWRWLDRDRVSAGSASPSPAAATKSFRTSSQNAVPASQYYRERQRADLGILLTRRCATPSPRSRRKHGPAPKSRLEQSAAKIHRLSQQYFLRHFNFAHSSRSDKSIRAENALGGSTRFSPSR